MALSDHRPSKRLTGSSRLHGNRLLRVVWSFASLACAGSLTSGCIPGGNLQQRRDLSLSAAAQMAPLVAADFEHHAENEAASAVQHSWQNSFAAREKNGLVPMSLMETIELGLSNTQVVRVVDGDGVLASKQTFYDLETAEAKESAALAAFDATLDASIYGRDIKRPPDSFFGPGLAQPLRRDEAAVNFGIRQPFVTGGQASLAYRPDPGYFFVANPTSSGFNPIRSSAVQLSVVQPLMRGAGKQVNLIPLQITQVRVDQSAWDFKKSAIASVADIIGEYWKLYASQEAVAAIDEVIPLFEEILRLQTEALAVGWALQADVSKAEAQLYDFRRQRLVLEQAAVTQELRLRNLAGLSPNLPWRISPVTRPASVRIETNQSELLQQALESQPDLVQQRLQLRIRQLELSLAKNQIKPDFNINALYRMNGNGENLGDALDQLATADFRDWEAGATLSVPIGRRAASAGVRAADQQLFRGYELLRQEVFSVNHRLVNARQKLDYLLRQLEESRKRTAAANEWVKGAKLRYQNPSEDDGGANWLLANLNDYIDAIRFKTRSVSEQASLLADYNIALAELEAAKGTLLEYFGIYYAGDPCRQAQHLRPENDTQVRAPEEEHRSDAAAESGSTGLRLPKESNTLPQPDSNEHPRYPLPGNSQGEDSVDSPSKTNSQLKLPASPSSELRQHSTANPPLSSDGHPEMSYGDRYPLNLSAEPEQVR